MYYVSEPEIFTVDKYYLFEIGSKLLYEISELWNSFSFACMFNEYIHVNEIKSIEKKGNLINIENKSSDFKDWIKEQLDFKL